MTGQTLPFLISDAVILCGQQGEEGEKWRQVYASVDAFICAGRSPFSYNESALSMTYKPGSNSTQKPFYPFATARDGFSPLPAPPPFGPRLSRVLGRPALAAGSDLPIYSQLQIEIGFLGSPNPVHDVKGAYTCLPPLSAAHSTKTIHEAFPKLQHHRTSLGCPTRGHCNVESLTAATTFALRTVHGTSDKATPREYAPEATVTDAYSNQRTWAEHVRLGRVHSNLDSMYEIDAALLNAWLRGAKKHRQPPWRHFELPPKLAFAPANIVRALDPFYKLDPTSYANDDNLDEETLDEDALCYEDWPVDTVDDELEHDLLHNVLSTAPTSPMTSESSSTHACGQNASSSDESTNDSAQHGPKMKRVSDSDLRELSPRHKTVRRV